MRVLDFLALIRTLQRQTHFYYEIDRTHYLPIVAYELVADKLCLLVDAKQHPRQQWEIFVLLQKKELLSHLLYVKDDKQQLQPIFGFRFENGKALLK
ncbi:hypothetical protein ACFQ5M_12900 [Agrilactobacillus yilanensis]|uniref:DUF960 domain-containing protein n=1 Tax=Agrilactobacillus yilanensis TaxID=2485997 RepID=A0ABW4J9T7_9LACO|nr:hypothetical protein [Agrilactobacillus yilanensis]